MKNLLGSLSILILSSIIYSQCDHNEAELWGTCYSIENTIVLNNPNDTMAEFPNNICQLSNLEVINFDVIWGETNFVHGQLPDCIGDLVNLTHINLGWNSMFGSLPSSLGNLENLIFFSVLYNDFTGSIPDSFGNLESLTYLNLGFNSFSGQIPESIGNLVHLEELYLTENFFSGRIPESIGNLTDLTMLSIYNNQFSGDIPESLGNLTSLVSINAGINQLTGQLPSSIGNLTNLERLWLNNNNLSGGVPYAVCDLELLVWAPNGFNGEHSYLHTNKLCPPYPACLVDDIGSQDISSCQEYDLGDINYDSQINIQDIVQIVNIILEIN